MTPVSPNTGYCPNLLCPKGATRAAIERYPGPGEFCPECGDPLESLAAPAAPVALTIAAASLPARAAAPALHDRFAPLLERIKSRPRSALAIAGGLALALVVPLTVAGPIAAARQSAVPVNICTTSSTARLAADLVHGYAAKNGGDVARFGLNRAGTCDVRFALAASADAKTIAAYDGFVVVANPQNPLTHLSVAQLGDIFAGTVTDWSQVGGRAGRIVPVLPPEGSDEAKALANLTRRTNAGTNVHHVASSGDVTGAVAAAAGRDAVGFVAFSSAVPAKVLTLDALPAPSAVSIAAHRYPLAVDVVVQAATSAPLGSSLTEFARSDDAQTIVTRDGFVAQRGY